ncbi:SDR family NAD(P)-dependent oxidoreductase [Aeromicrobium wangtongii]|uniref:SDR family oxidoreductase n=1 Tax=Aeromicrobium wangtongii TaxID=2969247 RepID=A0ABY5MDG3_9ACTN|nr:SDR family oxidoreductase [Aeromicrobium wangtongii]MCD9197699.1 SDR family oxidoreductase [Aeromicrobium wangtongii]MCL3818605.1 SDR family oxidoreductase [Aeromicrobium wangtongii]UUP15183.1 SDR family oxidoreductase [Aeromicrobium wangtongii]
MGRLDNKIAIVTGASTGIGRATFELFAREGATVVGCARTQSKLDEAMAAVEASGGKGMVVAADLSSDDGAAKLVDAALAAYGRVDVLVNNAGVGWAYGEANPGSMAKLHDTTPENWRTVMSIDLDSYYLVARRVLASMLENESGSIVNVASMGGVTGLYDGHTYTAAKGAIMNLTRSMAISYARQGIRTNNVCPGFIDTPMIASVTPAFADPEAAIQLSPIARAGRPEEVAAANLFFASDESSYCNGASLLVDGGTTARSFPG